MLDLSPIGFMVVTEAISHLLQEEEGAPLSAILAEIGHRKITLTLLRGGKAVEKTEGQLLENAPSTVDTLLKHFTTAVLPARIILFDGKNSEQLSQAFIGHSWSKSLPFLHVPQITVLPPGFDGRAVTYGAAAQMGFEMVGGKEPVRTMETTASDKPEKETEEVEEETPISEKDTQEPEENETKVSPKENGPSMITEDNFGFVMDADITKTPEGAYKNDEEAEQDLAMKHDDPHRNLQTVEEKEPFKVSLNQENIESSDEDDSAPSEKFAFLKNIRLPKIGLPAAFSGKRPFVLPLIILFLLIVGGGGLVYFYFNSMQANIVLTVKPKIVNQDAAVTFTGTGSSDFSKNSISAKSISTTVDGSLTIDTTGKKDVGNKAKGTVTVYNNDNSSTKLTSGTTIKSSNGLTFLLDKDISIASASGDIFSGTKPGTADVSVTARDIGTESNLPSGTKFSVGSNSNLAAKNDSAFSGGSKKQVQVVSKNDVAKLKSDLPDSLMDKAKTAISEKSDGSVTLLPLISVISLDKPKFDNNVDDEAKKVTLTATVEFEALAYANDELNSYAKSLLKDKYSQDISDKSIKISVVDPKETKDNQVAAKLAIQAGLLPDINTDDVIKKIESMSSGKAKEYLSGLPQVADTQISFSPAIPFLPNLFPKLPKQITVEIKPE